MKSGAFNHIKLRRLKQALGLPQYAAVGILESLWQLAAECADNGAIGRFTNVELASYIEWDGDPDRLIEVLVEAGWLDRDHQGGVSIHDWLDHCPKYVKDRIRQRQYRESRDKSVRVTGEGVTVTRESHMTPPSPTQPNQAKPEVAAPAEATARKPRQVELWDAVVDLFGLNPVTRSEKTRIGRVVRDLKLKGATPELIVAASVRYREEWPGMALTPEALLKHWDQFAHAPPEIEAEGDAAVDQTNQLLDSIRQREEELAGSEP